jgi:hypothetical protein
MNDQTDNLESRRESTYALLVRSEEKSRNAFEVLIYPLLMAGPLIAIWQFAQQPVNIPAVGLRGAGCLVCADEVPATRTGLYAEIKAFEK